MRVLVCGSREFKNLTFLRRRLAKLPENTTIIHGGAAGADTLAGDAAASLGFDVEVYLANWVRHDKAAGYIRNVKMVDSKPDLVIAFWNGVSKGTAHTIETARARNIPVDILWT